MGFPGPSRPSPGPASPSGIAIAAFVISLVSCGIAIAALVIAIVACVRASQTAPSPSVVSDTCNGESTSRQPSVQKQIHSKGDDAKKDS